MFDEMGERTDAFEHFLSEQIEGPATAPLQKAALKPENLNKQERAAVAMFMCVTATRTPAMLKMTQQAYFEQLPVGEVKDVRGLAQLWARHVRLPAGKDPLAEFAKPSAFGAILVFAERLRQRLIAWQWEFIRTDRSKPFVTSDWPVYGERDKDSGIEFVQFPVSSEVAVIAYSAGHLRSDRKHAGDVKAFNRGTLERAREFAVCRTPCFPGDEYLRDWVGHNDPR